MFQSGKHHAVCDCTYTRVPDVSVEIFAGTYFAIFPNRKNSQNIVPANNSNNKVLDKYNIFQSRWS